MTSKRQSVKNALAKAFVESSLDECFGRLSFARRKGSLLYKRTRADLSQEIEFHFDLSPRYKPEAIAHILPHIRMKFQPIVPIISAMTSNHSSARCFNGSLLFQNQINNIAPWGQRTHYWYLYNMDCPDECLGNMKVFIETWCLPFLEEFTSIEAIIKGYERTDERLHCSKQFELCIAACYILLKSPQKALEALERHFGRPGPRREYSQAFDYVSGLLK
jgi:hypothetical protein